MDRYKRLIVAVAICFAAHALYVLYLVIIEEAPPSVISPAAVSSLGWLGVAGIIAAVHHWRQHKWHLLRRAH